MAAGASRQSHRLRPDAARGRRLGASRRRPRRGSRARRRSASDARRTCATRFAPCSSIGTTTARSSIALFEQFWRVWPEAPGALPRPMHVPLRAKPKVRLVAPGAASARPWRSRRARVRISSVDVRTYSPDETWRRKDFSTLHARRRRAGEGGDVEADAGLRGRGSRGDGSPGGAGRSISGDCFASTRRHGGRADRDSAIARGGPSRGRWF